jgi:hypothetical protein
MSFSLIQFCHFYFAQKIIFFSLPSLEESFRITIHTIDTIRMELFTRRKAAKEKKYESRVGHLKILILILLKMFLNLIKLNLQAFSRHFQTSSIFLIIVYTGADNKL